MEILFLGMLHHKTYGSGSRALCLAGALAGDRLSIPTVVHIPTATHVSPVKPEKLMTGKRISFSFPDQNPH